MTRAKPTGVTLPVWLIAGAARRSAAAPRRRPASAWRRAAAFGRPVGLVGAVVKKKKKKKVVGDDFAKKLEALNLEEGKEEEKEAEKPEEDEQAGSFETGTGIWSHEEDAPIKYDLLLNRFFSLLAQKNPDHASSASEELQDPPATVPREGNKKTVFANIVVSNFPAFERARVLWSTASCCPTKSGTGRSLWMGRYQGR